MHPNSILIFKKHCTHLFRDGLSVLEIGPESFPGIYQRKIDNATITWHTLDIAPDRRLTYVATEEYAYPVPPNTYDVVMSAQVIEHVRHPWRWMRELARICKPGGHVLTICPVTWPYHEHPVDCWRIWPEGMRSLYEDAGLTTELAVAEALDAATVIDTLAIGAKP